MISRSNQTYLTDSQQSYLLLISYIIDLATAGICDYSELKCTTDNLVRNFGVSWDSHKMHRKCSIHFISWLYSICGRFSGKTERASYRGFHYLHTDSNFNSVKQVHSLYVLFLGQMFTIRCLYHSGYPHETCYLVWIILSIQVCAQPQSFIMTYMLHGSHPDSIHLFYSRGN